MAMIPPAPFRHRFRMKTYATLLTGLALALIPSASAADFSSGSTGALGALNVTTDTTIDLPPDGILHYTTINVSATLRFNRNALNTPVYMLATGDVTISGIIDVSGGAPSANGGLFGLGGPGGFDGGHAGRAGAEPLPGGNGKGPGGGRHGVITGPNEGVTFGSGSHGTRYYVGSFPNMGSGATYGSPLLVPLIGGSGGGGVDNFDNRAGGGGGGAILIASSTRVTLAGGSVIRAQGSPAGHTHYDVSNGGSGGAVRIVAPLVVGSGSIDVRPASSAGSGRIRIDSLRRFAATPADSMNITMYPDATVASYGAYMVVFPENPPSLAITQAAGQTIAEGTASSVNVALPFNSPPNTTVVVQARNFNGVVPIRVVLTPDHGDIVTYDAEIDNTTTNPASATVNVVLPANVNVDIAVWTR